MFDKNGGIMAKSKKVNLDLNPFAVRLKGLIEENKTSQQKVAEAIGVTRQALNNWVNGETIPDALVAAELALYFGVTVDYLVGNSPIKTHNADLNAAFANLGINEKAIEQLQRIYDFDLRYGDMSGMINTFLSCLEKRLFRYISDQLKKEMKIEIFAMELFRKYMADRGYTLSDEEIDDLLSVDPKEIKDEKIASLVDFFNEMYLDYMLDIYRLIDPTLKNMVHAKADRQVLTYALQRIINKTIDENFFSDRPDSYEPYDLEERKKIHEFYRDIINMELHSEEMNSAIIGAFYHNYDKIDDERKFFEENREEYKPLYGKEDMR